MSLYDFSAPRLFVEMPLEPDKHVEISRDQSHYLIHVLRIGLGGKVLLFNGKDGEWQAELVKITRKICELSLIIQTRGQPVIAPLWYAFAPLKSARLDYLIQKTVEMGITHLLPVLTRRTQVSRLNPARLRANAIEAAEQCGILSIPEIAEEIKFERFLANWQKLQGQTPGLLIFCDEDAALANPIAALQAANWGIVGPICLIIGPEGGFDDVERAALLAMPQTIRLSLGPRILRADTAAVAALALVQASRRDGGLP